MERVINVEGEASIVADCDRVRFGVKASEQDLDFERAIKHAKESIHKYLAQLLLTEFGIEVK